MLCVECGKRKVINSRKLCKPCWRDPEIRAEHPLEERHKGSVKRSEDLSSNEEPPPHHVRCYGCPAFVLVTIQQQGMMERTRCPWALCPKCREAIDSQSDEDQEFAEARRKRCRENNAKYRIRIKQGLVKKR